MFANTDVESIDDSRLGLWYQQHSHRGILYANSIVRCRQDAEEIVQDAFIRLLKRFTSNPIETEDRFRATFFTTIRNLCVDLLRLKKRRNNVSIEQVAEPVQRFNHTFEYEKADQEIALLINGLPENWSQALQLKVYGGLSYDEIADAMSSSKAQVRTWIYRARQKLKAELEKRN